MDRKAHTVVETYRELALAALPGRIVLFGSRGATAPRTATGIWPWSWTAPTFEDRRRLAGAGFQTLCRTGEVVRSLTLSRDEWNDRNELGRTIRDRGVVIRG